jgi:CRISPR-associated endonuclease/helicase Cas3
VTGVCEFATFYRAVHGGREPFPWQRRLAALVEQTGWPAEIGVPTGLGKTSCIDVAVWELARQASRLPSGRTAPTRTWYVVNRRLLVDSGFDQAVRLAKLLEDPELALGQDGDADSVAALRGVAGALSAIRGGAGMLPLHVCRLRGGAELGARPPDPSQPALIFATVPMFASRWLFRGFGTSANMRPVDAALAGIDTLVLLDEAHLARPLRDLAGPLAECDIGDPSGVVPAGRARPVLVSLTATGDAGDTFTLDEEDEAHPVVRRRVDASKPVHLHTATDKTMPTALARQIQQFLAGRDPTTAVVFANTPRRAREAFERIESDNAAGRFGHAADVELLTGLMRDREAGAVRKRLLDPDRGAPAGRDRKARERHLIVVATQTLEVGADLDFDVLVTEACGARALIQRMGRLNRLGDSSDPIGAIVYARDVKQFGPYGDEPRQVWQRLEATAVNQCISLEPNRIAEVVGSPEDAPPRVGELLPAHLWEWAKTTTPPEGEAPGELFYAGFDESIGRVSVVWRAVVPPAGTGLRPPISAAEAIEVPLWEAREALATLAGDRVARMAPNKASVEEVPIDLLRPGDDVVVSSFAGGYDAFGWAPDSREPVFDLSLLQPPGLPLVPRALRLLAAEGEDLNAALRTAGELKDPPSPDDGIDRGQLAGQLRQALLLAGPAPAVRPAEWQRVTETLSAQIDYPVDDVPRLIIRSPRRRDEVALRADAFDELSFTASSVALTQHLGSVGEIAARIAQRIGLWSHLVRAVQMGGRLHDLGKLDPRFQRWLDPHAVAAEPAAKSDRPWSLWEHDRQAAGWPKGGRHEELSRRLVAAWLDGRPVEWDTALVLHLVAAHHGYGRPLIAPVADETAADVCGEIDGVQIVVPGDLGQVDWKQPARFRHCCERYGYWGLALLEAIVRQADHQVSRQADLQMSALEVV